MITVHFNGDLVQSADMVKQAERQKIFAEQNRVCCYGRNELTCQTWINNCKENNRVKKISEFGRCHLKRCNDCPLYMMRKKAGEKVKKYRITSSDYRKMASGAHWLVKTNKKKAVFFTLTFPPLLKNHSLTKSFYLDEISNNYFSIFIENLKKTYGCTGYIAVKEHGYQNGRTHFHILATFSFIDFRILNNYWCSVINGICEHSNNALQTDSKSRIIRGRTDRAIRYICKYISKARKHNGESYTRLIFISHNLLHKKLPIHNISYTDILKGYKGIYIQSLDYVTILRVTDNKSFRKLCEEFIYEVFSDHIKTEIQQNST